MLFPSPGSFPGEYALAPGVPESNQENRDEHQHADEAANEQVAEDHRPQVDEDDLNIEGDEQQRIDVEREAEAAPRVAEGIDARLVGQTFVAVTLVAMPHQPSHQDRHEDERESGEGEAEDVPERARHAAENSFDCGWASWWLPRWATAS